MNPDRNVAPACFEKTPHASQNSERVHSRRRRSKSSSCSEQDRRRRSSVNFLQKGNGDFGEDSPLEPKCQRRRSSTGSADPETEKNDESRACTPSVSSRLSSGSFAFGEEITVDGPTSGGAKQKRMKTSPATFIPRKKNIALEQGFKASGSPAAVHQAAAIANGGSTELVPSNSKSVAVNGVDSSSAHVACPSSMDMTGAHRYDPVSGGKGAEDGVESGLPFGATYRDAQMLKFLFPDSHWAPDLRQLMFLEAGMRVMISICSSPKPPVAPEFSSSSFPAHFSVGPGGVSFSARGRFNRANTTGFAGKACPAAPKVERFWVTILDVVPSTSTHKGAHESSTPRTFMAGTVDESLKHFNLRSGTVIIFEARHVLAVQTEFLQILESRHTEAMKTKDGNDDAFVPANMSPRSDSGRLPDDTVKRNDLTPSYWGQRATSRTPSCIVSSSTIHSHVDSVKENNVDSRRTRGISFSHIKTNKVAPSTTTQATPANWIQRRDTKSTVGKHQTSGRSTFTGEAERS